MGYPFGPLYADKFSYENRKDKNDENNNKNEDTY